MGGGGGGAAEYGTVRGVGGLHWSRREHTASHKPRWRARSALEVRHRHSADVGAFAFRRVYPMIAINSSGGSANRQAAEGCGGEGGGEGGGEKAHGALPMTRLISPRSERCHGADDVSCAVAVSFVAGRAVRKASGIAHASTQRRTRSAAPMVRRSSRRPKSAVSARRQRGP